MFKNIKHIFFDFDGVILDSVDCKTQAFVSMYSKYGSGISEKVREYHLLNGGISRFEKFRYWHKNLLNITLEESEVQEMANEFSSLVLDNVITSNEIPGAYNFIKKNYTNFNFWVITGTPTDEIIVILRELDLCKYFKNVYGSPNKKTFWTEHIIKSNKLIRDQVLFIGDAMTDYDASLYSKINFTLRSANYNEKMFNNINVFKFKNFKSLQIKLYE
jgi:phosphoglycolate phosphatase-like HAD superfamily hydrolase